MESTAVVITDDVTGDVVDAGPPDVAIRLAVVMFAATLADVTTAVVVVRIVVVLLGVPFVVAVVVCTFDVVVRI